MDGRNPRSLSTPWRICRYDVAHRDQGQVMVRAYELLLPVIRHRVGAVAKESPVQPSRRSAAGGR